MKQTISYKLNEQVKQAESAAIYDAAGYELTR
jgi:hypothetical protein